jgi:hypothetical protein
VAINLLAALKVIPWVEILKQAPAVAHAADRLFSETRWRKADAQATNEVDALREHVTALEQRIQDNAAVVKQLADQVQRLTDASQVVAARVRFAYFLAFGGTGLALVATVLVLTIRS